MIAAAEEERFNRVKHTKAFPIGAIQYCLRQAGIDSFELDRVALFVDPKRHFMLPIVNLYHGFPHSLGSLGSDLSKIGQRNAAGWYRSWPGVLPQIRSPTRLTLPQGSETPASAR